MARLALVCELEGLHLMLQDIRERKQAALRTSNGADILHSRTVVVTTEYWAKYQSTMFVKVKEAELSNIVKGSAPIKTF
jgi:hypothetical protein